MSEKYIEYNHTQLSENTVGKFFYRNDILVSGMSVVDFVRYDGGTGKKNIERIYDKYNGVDKAVYKDTVDYIKRGKKYLIIKSEVENLPLYNQPILLVPVDHTKKELVSINGKNQFLERKDFMFFFADKLYQLLNDKGYVRSENLIKLEGRNLDIEVIQENVQVWIWSRVLNKIVDVSPFILNLSTDKSDIGSFSFSLNPIHSLEKLESLDRNNVLNYFNLNEGSDHNIDEFNRIFQYNDVVFIRFEKLQMEESDKAKDYTPTVDKVQLPNQVWDMIGLIDSVSLNQSFSNSSHDISVSGRDMMKLLIEDGSYFMNLALLQGSDQRDLIIGFNKEDKWFKRNIYNGRFGGVYSPYWFPNSARSIRDTLGFIINQLSNLGVLGGEDLFSSYAENKRSKKYEVSGLNDEYLKTIDVDGVWQIIKLLVDRSVDKRRISDDSLSYVDGTIIEQINKACQQPFVEFFGDTYGDEFNMIVRQPPFTGDMITSFLLGKHDLRDNIILEGDYQIIEVDAKDLQGYNSLQFDTTYYSWYQLNPNDSFLGAFNKLAMGSLIPIIYFEEIAECFGNHRLIIPDNYLNANIINGSEDKKDQETYRRALLNDLKYVIDSNIYLPFTRKGSLTLVKGDRRIKKGTFIRVNPTREIFYVDAVSNSVSFTSDRVDRSTTIRVSRGMIEDYIYSSIGFEDNGEIINKGGKPQKFSYFKIANTIINSTEQVVQEDFDQQDQPSSKSGLLEVNKYVLFYKPIVERYFPQDQVDNALRIMMAESSGDPNAVNTNNLSTLILTKYYGSKDSGLFQINSVAHPESYSSGDIFNPEHNIKEAARIYSLRGWGEWSTSKIPGVILESTPTQNIGDKQSMKKTKVVFNDNFDFSINKDQFEFFLKRKQLNIYKYGRGI